MNTKRMVCRLLFLALVVLFVGGQWSLSITLNQQITKQQIRYHEGSLKFYKAQDPTDQNSNALYHFIQKLDLEREQK